MTDHDDVIPAPAPADEAVERIFKWLLGEEGEWPERKQGQGSFYWRIELRKRIAALNQQKP